MNPLHATIEEFAAEGYTHIECFCPRCRVIRLRPMSWLPRISMGLTLDAACPRLRCASAPARYNRSSRGGRRMRAAGLGLSARPSSAVRLSGAALPPWVKRGFADQAKSALGSRQTHRFSLRASIVGQALTTGCGYGHPFPLSKLQCMYWPGRDRLRCDRRVFWSIGMCLSTDRSTSEGIIVPIYGSASRGIPQPRGRHASPSSRSTRRMKSRLITRRMHTRTGWPRCRSSARCIRPSYATPTSRSRGR